MEEHVVAVLFDPACDGTESVFRSCSGVEANSMSAESNHQRDVGVMCTTDTSLLSEHPTGHLG